MQVKVLALSTKIMAEIPLKCSCGEVRGVARQVTPSSGNRIVCCCDDCQQFARYLGREAEILDEYGGTDIFQMPIARVEIHQGRDRLRCLRLSEKGLLRWYAECCNTPIGNTISGSVPFIGVIHNFMDADERERDLGPVLGYIYTRYSPNSTLPERSHPAIPAGIGFRGLGKIALWKIQGLDRPSAFFDSQGDPIVEPIIVR